MELTPHHKLKFLLFFLLEKATVGFCISPLALGAARRTSPTPNPAATDLHVARSPDSTKDITRVESSADRGPILDCGSANTAKGGRVGGWGRNSVQIHTWYIFYETSATPRLDM